MALALCSRKDNVCAKTLAWVMFPSSPALDGNSGAGSLFGEMGGAAGSRGGRQAGQKTAQGALEKEWHKTCPPLEANTRILYPVSISHWLGTTPKGSM